MKIFIEINEEIFYISLAKNLHDWYPGENCNLILIRYRDRYRHFTQYC